MMRNYSRQFKQFNNEDLYQTIKKYIIREELGYYVNSEKFKILYAKIQKTNSDIFEKALKDALFILNQIRNEMGEVKVIDLKRIDFLTKEQLKILLFTIGAAKNHENISEKDTEITSFSHILGMDLEDLLVCKVAGDSMENAHIFEGDTLIIDTKATPRDGEIVVITINNQTVVKRLKLLDSKMQLVPENEKFNLHEISENDMYTILGKVKHIIHSL